MSDFNRKDDLSVRIMERLPEKIKVLKEYQWVRGYKYTYTTGPFCLPQNTHSLDWGLLNNDPSSQKVRVTVFKCSLLTTKTIEPPGPLEITVDPGETTHNANNANGGFFYEIQVECNSKLIFPYVAAWPGSIGDPLPGTVINSANFIRKMN
ncbi:MAG: hypothetical protein ACFFDH_07505 [Promethearchaeota archaeon]